MSEATGSLSHQHHKEARMASELVERLRYEDERHAQYNLSNRMHREAADHIETLEAENARLRGMVDGYGKLDAEYALMERRALQAEAALVEKDKEIEALLELPRWAHDTPWEINLSNYDHDDVCRLNNASVEVILGLAPTLGETHGKTKEWGEERDRNAGGTDADR